METLILFYFIIALIVLAFFMIKRMLSPTTIFIVSQIIFFIGLVQFLNFNSAEDQKIVRIYILAISFFGVGSALGAKIFPYSRKNITFTQQPFLGFQKQRVSILIFISICLLVYFCYKTRLSTLTVMFENLLSDELENITNSRLEAYSVPGTAIIYMFRVTIFPIIIVSIMNKEYGYSWPKKAIYLLVMLLFTLITGQRAGFTMVIFMWILSYMIKIFYNKGSLSDKVNKSKKQLKRQMLLLIAVFFAVFSFMSIINGRVSQSVFSAILNRFLSDNQRTAYASFKYFFDHDITWGRNWYEEFVNLVYPGERYLPVAKVVFEILYGSTRGTAPPCLWGSAFYNFSWGGVALFAVFYGIFLQYIEYRFYSREINSIRCAIYSYIFVSLGMFIAGSPFQLVNNGFLPSVLLAFILHVDNCAQKTRYLAQ